MTDYGWTVLGYVVLMMAFLGLVTILGLPHLSYSEPDKSEIVRLLRDVAIAAVGYVFGRGRPVETRST